MAKRNSKRTKSRIVSAAWKLFYEQGYEDTTIEEIIEVSQTSKGSFYHYFEGKDALLGSLAYMMDEKWMIAYNYLQTIGKNIFQVLDMSFL